MTGSGEPKTLASRTLHPAQALALGFLALILLGGLTLSLPVSGAAGRSIGLLRGMFTATSAVCVTGLTLVDAGLELSRFGQATLLLLIQIGGLGFMVFTTLTMVLLGRRVSLRNRVLLSESMNQNGLGGMVRLTLWFAGLALLIELAGAAVLALRLIPAYGVGLGLWHSVFLSVSAFCNAGFDLMGSVSLLPYNADPTVLLTLAFLIILGGLGFAVILECLQHRRGGLRLSLHAKIVLWTTGALIVVGTVAVLALEWNNPKTLNAPSLTVWDKLTNSFFQSVTFRTAGFASLDQAALSDATKLLGCVWMFVGASPASTGGGVKTTTVASVLLLVIAIVRGRDHVTVFGRELAPDTPRRAIALVTIALGFTLLTTLVISVLERGSGIAMLDLLFETTSAVTTTGLSSAGTVALGADSQILLMPLMYLGRVGPLTLATALLRRMNGAAQNRVRRPEEKIMIG